jgi:branched-chain amino acid transport system ATP-binding protein
MPILEVDNLQKSFGALVAVDGLTMDVEEGSITGLIGPNGAGKSTAFNLITGMIQPDSGTVRFRGTDITHWESYEVAQGGIGRTFQHARIFDKMTVQENLEVVPCPASDPADEVDRLLSLVELDQQRDSFGEELSGGQQVLLGIARTLMLQPDLIMLDEPFAGVNPGLVSDIAKLLRRLRDEEDRTVFLIDHEIDEIAALCDDVVVMAEGKLLVRGEPDDVRTDERVVESYLGGAM